MIWVALGVVAFLFIAGGCLMWSAYHSPHGEQVPFVGFVEEEEDRG